MPIHSATNLYPGINAHLNSLLQQRGGGWESFHPEYIAAIRRSLDVYVPSGYYAAAEKSLQVGVVDLYEPSGMMTRRTTYPDIEIYRTKTGIGSSSASATPTSVLPLARYEDDEPENFFSVVIYQLSAGGYPGQPVTRIELLSPANKPPHSYAREYLRHREETFRSGITLVEIDLLHHQAPLYELTPNYRTQQPGSHPYHILISLPQLETVEYYGIGVVEPIPPLALPLADAERLNFDLNSVYADLYASTRVYEILVDYAEDLMNFDRYTPDDQNALRQFLEGIRKQAIG